MSVKHGLNLTVVALVALLAWQLSAHPGLPARPSEADATPPGTVMMASWANTPASVEEAVELSDEVVVGRVVRVRKARDLEVDAPGEPGGVHRIPVETVTFQVEKVHLAPTDRRGRPETIEIFHTGGVDDEGRDVMLEGDPEYRPGQRYLLFLTEGPELEVEGTRLLTRSVISPEGRYGVGRNGRLDPASRGRGFAAEQRGQPLAAFERAIQASAGRRGGG